MTVVQLDQIYQLIDERRQSVPENCVKAYPCISTSADIDIRVWMNQANLPTLLWEFQRGSKAIYPTKPVPVNISRGDNLYFAENKTLGIFATGESRDAAIEDFAEQVLYFYEYYKAMSWDKVIGEARRLKEIYSDHFKEEEV